MTCTFSKSYSHKGDWRYLSNRSNIFSPNRDGWEWDHGETVKWHWYDRWPVPPPIFCSFYKFTENLINYMISQNKGLIWEINRVMHINLSVILTNWKFVIFMVFDHGNLTMRSFLDIYAWTRWNLLKTS